ncbi:MAG: amidohydrolase [Desulfarculaceae bacterium]|nr:amidohydrolase [Desulfarculaceae bacterium]MCF8071178.1 amidohydrolase [Desulfarculaceae bacterium]MCF8101219.1 amidohydrolase [Desulfarculaceae bacterium]MCF8115232.1 amidohydrolase [Desulfarculaceae bacterium]
MHQIPETAFQEHETSKYVARFLAEAGLAVDAQVAGTGVVGLLDSDRPGPCLMIRADMDALPVEEQTGLSFASRNPGCMHACGHDSHMAMALTTAAILSELREHLRGSVKFVFQPAEEGPGGAAPMIQAGVMDNPRVDHVVGFHVWPALPKGVIGIKSGVLMAAMDRFDLTVKGAGGHGGMPHLCVDALEVGAQVVGALQRLVSRQINPLHPAVVTVGRFEAGSAFNVIAEEANLSGTIRTMDREVRAAWPERLERIIAGVCGSMGAEYDLSFKPGYPPMANAESMTSLARECVLEAWGADAVAEPEPTMGSEDMAFFLEKAPGCMLMLGCGEPGCVSLHNPRFDFDEEVLGRGVEIYCRLAAKLLGQTAG